jgi:GDP-L-fucose synthase
MNKTSKIYVAGHTGLIGSAILRKLKAGGYRNILTKTHAQLDLTRRQDVERFFAKHKPEYVFLAAARVGGIHANKTFPGEFIFQNIMIQAHVLDLARQYKVKKLLFLTSSCVYPRICSQPMKVDSLFTGALEPTNEAYGMAKLAGIKMCQAYNRQYGTNFITVIPANVYGVNDHFDENGHVLAALIAKFHQAKTKGEKSVVVWGTGKPKREFFYVDDLADAGLFLMRSYQSSEPINVGIGRETSIAQLARMIGKTVGYKGQIVFDTTKPDGNPRRWLDSGKIFNMGWKPRFPLADGLAITYDWYKKNKT